MASNNLSPQQKKLLYKIRNDAQEVLSTCEAAEQGQITAEQFESRISKALAALSHFRPA